MIHHILKNQAKAPLLLAVAEGKEKNNYDNHKSNKNNNRLSKVAHEKPFQNGEEFSLSITRRLMSFLNDGANGSEKGLPSFSFFFSENQILLPRAPPGVLLLGFPYIYSTVVSPYCTE